MSTFSQGDILKIDGYKYRFLVVSKNAFIKSTGVFHVCPIIRDLPDGPLHIKVKSKKIESGTALCEQIKMIDPSSRSCSIIDTIPYDSIMNISDAIQGIFEYD